MSYTRRLFNAKEHACDGFLGQQVLLPELHDGFHPRLVASLENPLDSVEAAWEFVDCMKWGFLSGMDDKLAPEHWGVAWARGCEAMFWRLQDLLAPEPLWGLSWKDSLSFLDKDGQPEENVDLACRTLSVFFYGGSTNLKRDLLVYSDVKQTRLSVNEHTLYSKPLETLQARVVPNPVPERLESDFDRGYGEKFTYAFWQPMDVPLVTHSLDAWDAVRMGQNKFVVEPLAHFKGNPIEAMRRTFGDRCAMGLRAYALSKALPSLAPPSGAKPRF